MTGTRLALLLVAYACAFLLLHDLAAYWGTQAFYSLWFPPAGLRFALLWHFGPWLTVPLALSELAAQIAAGRVAFGAADGLLFAASVVGPPLAYGGAVLLVWRRIPRYRTALSVAPMPLGLAAIAAPLFGSLASLPFRLLDGEMAALDGLPDAVAAIVIFMLGDLLGVILIAPPLLWILAAYPKLPRIPAPRLGDWSEIALVWLLAWAAVLTIYSAGLGIRLHPVLLATLWLGLRFGRATVWFAILTACLLTLPLPPELFRGNQRLTLHMMLACIAIAGYLVASYSEAEARLRRDLNRRDRLLFHADRLKTLRAMSVAIIHEISQPLATLAIESKYLVRASGDGSAAPADLKQAAALVEGKVAHLSELVGRLRDFGARSGEGATAISVRSLIRHVTDLLAIEAREKGVTIGVRIGPDLSVRGEKIELQQVLINLGRNAISASPGRDVTIAAQAEADGMVRIDVVNTPVGEPAGGSGMGVGLIVARSIAEANGGRLADDILPGGDRRYSLILPTSDGASHDEPC